MALSKSHRKDQYRWKRTGKPTVYIRSGQHSLAKSLAQKDYAQRVLLQANRELLGIDRLMKEGRIFQTESGLMVRSKSEVIIADKLFRAGLPFKYERPASILGNTIYPDFTILDRRTREEVLWEHFGIMNDASYCNHCLKKISLYAAGGFLLGDKLIATFESSTVPLDTSIVDRLIAGLLS